MAMPTEIETLTPYEITKRLTQASLNEAEIKSVLLSLTAEKLTADSVSDWLSALLDTAPSIKTELPVLDCCGTGGSGLPHFNTSTTVAFILAAAGIPVVKFGNRGIQQPHGSFDFLAKLGFNTPIPIEKTAQMLDKANLSFLFAPQCYPYLAPLHQVRKTLSSPTLFHYIGPLLNPVLPAFRMMGISNQLLIPILSQVLSQHSKLSNHGSRSLLIHTSLDNTPIGLDELAPIGTPVIQDIQGERQQLLGIKPTTINNAKTAITNILSGLTVDDSVSIFHKIIQGEVPKRSFKEWLQKTDQPISPEERFSFCYELVIQNAALGFITANKSESLEAGIALATETLAGKAALNTFKRYQDAYNVYCP